MPAAGSDQQRQKVALDITKERLSIEREIRDALADQKSTLDDSFGVEDKLIKMLKKNAERIESLGKRRITLETKMRTLQRAELLASDKAKPGIQARIATLKKDIEKAKLRADIASLLYDKTTQQIAAQKVLLAEDQARMEKAMSYLGRMGDIFQMQHKHYTGLKAFIGLQGKSLILASSFMAVLEMSFETFKKMDEALAKFRMEMGMLRKDAAAVSAIIRDVAISFTSVGVTVEGAAMATMKLGEEFGGTAKISKDLVETASLLKAQLGVAEESSAGFLRNMAALSKTSAQSQRHMVYIADAMTSAAGIPLNLVMQDVAKMSGNALALVNKMPLAIVKTAVEARRMGTTINKMADASSQLLNFTESVQAEMEASVLAGQAINLQRARELAYSGKIVESTKEILNQAKKIDFEHLDYFQMQAFAAASGRSADEILKMVQAERQLREARNIAGLKEEVSLYDSLQAKTQAQLNTEAKRREQAVMTMANQARMTALQQQWNQLWMETMRVMFPVFDTLLKVVTVMVKIGPPIMFVAKTISWIAAGLEHVGAGAGKFSGVATKIFDFFVKIGGIVTKFIGKLGFVGKIFGILGKGLGLLKFAAPFAKAVPVIGWIIAAIQFVANLFKRLQGFTEIWRTKGPGHALWFGIKAVMGAVYDTLLKPFVDVYNWIMKWLGGHSPSHIGLMIVKGVIGVQAMIFDALTYPFRKFLSWIVEKIPGMGGVAKKISGGVSGALSDMGVLEKKKALAAQGATTEAIPVTKPTPVIAEVTATQQKQSEADSATLGEILKNLQALNSNLLAGKIGVYIDGQLISATLARQTAFKGGYGVNSV